MRRSGKRYLHNCSFRSEENKGTEDKLITLMKKQRGDPCTNSVRADKNQVAKWNTKQSGFSLKDKKVQILDDFRARDSET